MQLLISIYVQYYVTFSVCLSLPHAFLKCLPMHPLIAMVTVE